MTGLTARLEAAITYLCPNSEKLEPIFGWYPEESWIWKERLKLRLQTNTAPLEERTPSKSCGFFVLSQRFAITLFTYRRVVFEPEGYFVYWL